MYVRVYMFMDVYTLVCRYVHMWVSKVPKASSKAIRTRAPSFFWRVNENALSLCLESKGQPRS